MSDWPQIKSKYEPDGPIPEPKTFGQHLRRARKLSKMSLRHMATVLKMTAVRLSSAELDKLDLTDGELRAFASATSSDVETLFAARAELGKGVL